MTYHFKHTPDGDVIAEPGKGNQNGYFMTITDNIAMTVDGDKYMAIGNKAVDISHVSLSDIDPVRYPAWM